MEDERKSNEVKKRDWVTEEPRTRNVENEWKMTTTEEEEDQRK